MSAESSNELRTRLTEKYIGRDGIHGIGVGTNNGAPVVYVYANRKVQRALVDQLTHDAQPRQVVIRREDIPKSK